LDNARWPAPFQLPARARILEGIQVVFFYSRAATRSPAQHLLHIAETCLLSAILRACSVKIEAAEVPGQYKKTSIARTFLQGSSRTFHTDYEHPTFRLP